MTTVTYRDGVLAADRMRTANGTIVGEVTKVHRANDGRIFACAGSCSASASFIKWLVDGTEPAPAAEEFEAIAVSKDGVLHRYEVTSGKFVEFLQATAPFHAIGSGSDIALGAMAAGATAVQAIEIASKLDCHTGLGVDALMIET